MDEHILYVFSAIVGASMLLTLRISQFILDNVQKGHQQFLLTMGNKIDILSQLMTELLVEMKKEHENGKVLTIIRAKPQTSVEGQEGPVSQGNL